MKREEIRPIGVDIRRDLRLLLCDIAGDITYPPSSQEEMVASPIRCLDRAVDWKPEILMVLFGQISIRQREALVELITALKRNSHTKQCTVLALLRSKHRKLMENLEKAKADYVRYIGEARLHSNILREIIENLGVEDRLRRHLETLCPFLHYSRIDSQHEMTVCGAYLDRMVLGGRRLHELCETDDHLHCECYSNPRPGK